MLCKISSYRCRRLNWILRNYAFGSYLFSLHFASLLWVYLQFCKTFKSIFRGASFFHEWSLESSSQILSSSESSECNFWILLDSTRSIIFFQVKISVEQVESSKMSTLVNRNVHCIAGSNSRLTYLPKWLQSSHKTIILFALIHKCVVGMYIRSQLAAQV